MNDDNNKIETPDVEKSLEASSGTSEVTTNQTQNNVHKSRKKLWYVVAVLIVVCGVSGTALYVSRSNSEVTSENTDTSTVENRSDEAVKTEEISNQSVVFTTESKLQLYNKINNTIETIVAYPEEYSGTVDRVRTSSLNPTGTFVLYTYSAHADGTISRFGYYKTALNLYDVQKKTTTTIVSDRTSSITDIQWSPDGKYFSYVVDNGKRVEIRTIDNTAVATIDASEVMSPVVWRDQDTISYIKDGILYSGSLENLEQETIATDAVAIIEQFEGPGEMRTPQWAGEYVAYSAKDEVVKLLNVKSKEVVSLGTFLNGFCLDDCPVNDFMEVQGWLDDSRLLYIKNQSFEVYDVSTARTKALVEKAYDYEVSLKSSLFIKTIYSEGVIKASVMKFAEDTLVDVCTVDITPDTTSAARNYRVSPNSSVDLFDNGVMVARKELQYSRFALNDPEPPGSDITFDVFDASTCKLVKTVSEE